MDITHAGRLVTARPEADLLGRLTVVVDGSGPTAARVASSLRAVGLGRVHRGPYAAEPPLWGRSPERGRAAHPPADGRDGPAAVVFVRSRPLDPLVAEPWRRAGVLHLPVRVDADGAEIGPLVVPGVTSCSHCHALVRHAEGRRLDQSVEASADAALPAVLATTPGADHRAGHRGLPDPATTELAAAIAALVVRQALCGDHDLAGISSEIAVGRPEVLHRHWPRQLDCPCSRGWTAGTAAPVTMGA